MISEAFEKPKFEVSEIFRSIEGEGIDVGTPTVFLRLSKCNLRCKNCDTGYAKEPGDWRTLPEVVSLVLDMRAGVRGGIKRLSITGGEPTLQDLHTLVQPLIPYFAVINVETNCTKGVALPGPVKFTVSPKLKSSGSTYCPKTLEWYASMHNAYFKFVVGDFEDLEELKKILEKYTFKNPVYVQPWYIPGWTMPRYVQAIRELVEETLHYNLPVRVVPQLHKILWGELLRGV